MQFSIAFCVLIALQRTFLAHALESNGTQRNILINGNLPLSLATTEATVEVPKMNNDTVNGLGSCIGIVLSPGEYLLLPNGSAHVEVYNTTYDPSSYYRDGDSIIVCFPTYTNKVNRDESEPKFDESLIYITEIGLGMSMLCLVFHLFVFLIVPDMRNQPGYNLASLCCSLFFGCGFFIVTQAKMVDNLGVLCIYAASGLQFFMLSSFFWMSTMSFDVFRSLVKVTGKLRRATGKFSYKKYCLYCLYSWGTPLLFVIVTLVLENAEGVPDNLRPTFGRDEICWFKQKIPLLVVFALPVMLIVVSNVIFFGLSAYIIYSNRMKVEEKDKAYKRMLKRNFLIYSRLAIIMGLAWFAGILANLFDTIWLWYIYELMNSLQGFFIFLAFTCTRKVKKHLITKLTSSK